MHKHQTQICEDLVLSILPLFKKAYIRLRPTGIVEKKNGQKQLCKKKAKY